MKQNALACTAYPNPAVNGSFHMSYPGEKSESLSVNVTDITGRAVDRQRRTVSGGYNIKDYSLKAAPGVYFIKVGDAAGAAGTMLIVMQ